MSRTWRFRPPHANAGRTERNPRTRRLLKREWQQAASAEHHPALLPVICDGCGTVLGLVEIGEEIVCVDCGVWAKPIEDLAASAGVPE